MTGRGMSPELLSKMVDVSKQMDPTTAQMVRTINALAHNCTVLEAEVIRLAAENERPTAEQQSPEKPRG